ncbi:MAG: hypothetical protein M0Q87_09450, partial [Ottowia sp.]|nr:hypothetical protein [Ottowia sp.]
MPTTPSAQRSTSPSTLNLPIMAAQPQSLPPRSGAVIRSASEVICHPSCATPNAQRSTLNAQRSTLNAQRSTLNAQ